MVNSLNAVLNSPLIDKANYLCSREKTVEALILRKKRVQMFRISVQKNPWVDFTNRAW